MRQSRQAWRIVGWLADLAALGAAWWLTITVLLFEPRGVFRVEPMAGLMILVPALNAIWLQIRLTPRISALAHKARREELALTSIRPGEYLMPRLKWRFVRALLPMVTTLPFQATCLLIEHARTVQVFIDILLGVATCVAWLVLGMCLAVFGVFDMLARLCKPGNRNEAALFLIPSGWVVFSIGAPAGLLWLWGVFLFEVMKTTYEPGALWMIGLGLLLLVAAVVFTVMRWRWACARYYYFG